MRIIINDNTTINANIIVRQIFDIHYNSMNSYDHEDVYVRGGEVDDDIISRIYTHGGNRMRLEIYITGHLTMNGVIVPIGTNTFGQSFGSVLVDIFLSGGSLKINEDRDHLIPSLIIQGRGNRLLNGVIVNKLLVQEDSEFTVEGKISVNNKLLILGDPKDIDYSNLNIDPKCTIGISGVKQFTLEDIGVQTFNPRLDHDILFFKCNRQGEVRDALKHIDHTPEDLRNKLYSKDEMEAIEIYKMKYFSLYTRIAKSIKWINNNGTHQKLPECVLQKVFAYLMIDDIKMEEENSINDVLPLFHDVPEENMLSKQDVVSLGEESGNEG